MINPYESYQFIIFGMGFEPGDLFVKYVIGRLNCDRENAVKADDLCSGWSQDIFSYFN